jgi:hypothetical protein
METLGDNWVTKNEEKNPQKYSCKKCDYKCSKKYNMIRHLACYKHEVTLGDNLVTKMSKNEQTLHFCNKCNKKYSSRNGLWKHKKICNNTHVEITNEIKNNEPTDKELIMMLIKENSELKSMMIKVLENGTNSHNTNSHNTNSNNKTFNLQVFLNETCKDAMNISEFIENISLQLSDLENMGKLGYVDGVSNIIIKNLNALEVEKRPMHCTDKKREIVYVKEDDEWQKEENDKKRIKQVISGVVSKNLQLLAEYEDKYPECMNPESKKSDEYNKIIMETIGGGTDVIERNKEKVIRKIAKEITIDKQE